MTLTAVKAFRFLDQFLVRFNKHHRFQKVGDPTEEIFCKTQFKAGSTKDNQQHSIIFRLRLPYIFVKKM